MQVVSCFELMFNEADVCVGFVCFGLCYCCLVDDARLEAVVIKRAFGFFFCSYISLLFQAFLYPFW